MRVLITGGSHTGALVEGQRRLQQLGQWPARLDVDIVPLGGSLNAAGRFWEMQEHRLVITHENYRRRLSNFGPTETPYDAVGLSSPYYSRTLWSRADSGQFDLSGPDSEPGRTPLSQALLRQAIQQHNGHLIDFLVDLQRLGFRAFAIDAPRPFRHNPTLARVGVQAVRRFDALYRQHTRDELERRGIPTIAVPRETHDEDGFSLPQFRHESLQDSSHGNTDLGMLFMGEIVAWLQRAETPDVSGAPTRKTATA